MILAPATNPSLLRNGLTLALQTVAALHLDGTPPCQVVGAA
jgi:hypothetical protein